DELLHALDRRSLGNPVEPGPQVLAAVEIEVVQFVVGDPRPDRAVRDGELVAGDIRSLGELVVVEIIEPVVLAAITLRRTARLSIQSSVIAARTTGSMISASSLS